MLQRAVLVIVNWSAQERKERVRGKTDEGAKMGKDGRMG